MRCELSGVVVTAIPHDDWVAERPYRCHVCGAMVTYRIRANSDYAGQARLHTHDVPNNTSQRATPAMSQTHTIKRSGAPYSGDGKPMTEGKITSGIGHAMCACGAVSREEFPTRGERRMWHAGHKTNLPTPKPPKTRAPKKEKTVTETPIVQVAYCHLSKSYLKSAGAHGAQQIAAAVAPDVRTDLVGQTVLLWGDKAQCDEVAALLRDAWQRGAPLFKTWAKGWRSSEPGYDTLGRAEKNNAKFAAGTEFLTQYMTGYAAQLAGKAKTKGMPVGYRVGATAAAPADDLL